MHRITTRSILLATLLAGVLIPFGCMTAGEKGGGADNSKKPVLALTIRCDQKILKAGDEIPITFVIKNEGDAPYEYIDRDYDRSGRMDEYMLSATGPDGTAVGDPRAHMQGAMMGGGLGGYAKLAPGQSFSKTIALNLWALVTKPGCYRITGVYYSDGATPVHDENQCIVSAPLEVVLQGRSDAEMGEYIKGLDAQLQASLKLNQYPDGVQTPMEIVQKLMFTCDRRIVPSLIDAMYEDKEGKNCVAHWAEEAFNFYLPKDDRNTATLVNAAAQRGMVEGMYWSLKLCGCPREQFKKLIGVSLSADHPDAWAEGAAAAEEYADDSFTPRLIAIATDKQTDMQSKEGRFRAIYALAFNRTDESVAALKQLLQDPQTPENLGGRSIGQQTAEAIRDAYLSRGNSEGRKLRPDDFGPEFQHQ